ncbi:MAG: guanylate kinase [Planctomycetota bacterium]|nr:MAG: guanylate kinase [Planctomycetota bacterium]
MNCKGLLLVLSGPSGSGKTSIARAVEKRLDAAFSVSATTRPRSDGETAGCDYEFMTDEAFQELVDSGAFLEHAQVYGRYRYGTLREPVERQLAEGRVVILDIDVQGALQVRASMPDAMLLFVLPPNDEILERRLRGRGRDDEPSIRRRLAEARREVDVGLNSGAYDARIVNDDLDKAIDQACELARQRRAGEDA